MTSRRNDDDACVRLLSHPAMNCETKNEIMHLSPMTFIQRKITSGSHHLPCWAFISDMMHYSFSFHIAHSIKYCVTFDVEP